MTGKPMSAGLRLREWIRATSPSGLTRLLTTLYRLASPAELRAIASFLRTQHGTETAAQRAGIVLGALRTSIGVDCAHRESEALAVCAAILAVPAGRPGVVVEAGSFKGGSAAKFSRAAAIAGRRVHLFDSFEGIPDNAEGHDVTIFGTPTGFGGGDYAGSTAEVRRTLARYGRPEVCELHQGWFEDTMPSFSEPVAVAYIDVDLASSTRTCLLHLYPLLIEGGVILDQDGHLPLVVEVLRDETFWREQVGAAQPQITGLGERKLVQIAG
jgi:O-methyltransferase